MGREPLWIISV